MNTYFLYLTLLLLMFILIYYGVSFSFSFAPLKIRIVSLAAFIIISFRYIALLILLITGNIKNLYLLKPCIFLNLLCIPILGATAMYIFARNDKLKFNLCIIIACVLMVTYVAGIIILPTNIEIYPNLGYVMTFTNELLIYGIYLIINTTFFFNAVIFLGNKTSNKFGMRLIIASAFIACAELIAKACGLTMLPAVLFGDIIWIITADYALYKLKK